MRTIRMRGTDGINGMERSSPRSPAPSLERAQALDQEAHEGGRVDVDGDTGVGLAAAAAAPVDDRAPARKLRRAFHLDVQVLRGQEPRAHELGYRDRVVHRVPLRIPRIAAVG